MCVSPLAGSYTNIGTGGIKGCELGGEVNTPHRLTGRGQALGLGGRLGLGGEAEAASFADAVAHQGDVLLEASSVGGQPQLGAPLLGQRRGLVLGAPREAAPQEVGDGGVAALLPALRREDHMIPSVAIQHCDREERRRR